MKAYWKVVALKWRTRYCKRKQELHMAQELQEISKKRRHVMMHHGDEV